MADAVRVRTRAGELEGFESDGVRVFRGIPYAAPPVGRLRFAAPQPPEGWLGVRDAREFGPAPPQPVDALSKTLGLLGDHEQSEDCLSLNVASPVEPGPPRAVMVWLHGGAFQTGTAAGPVYDGRALARRGDVVVVTLNYRVGALGFLHLASAGAGGEGAAVHPGLLDQLAALRFVRREIAAFGGDPARVTVFGESAGAGSLCALLSMPAARGLFQRAIVQSAAPEGVLSAAEAHTRAEILCRELGLADVTSSATLSALRSLPWKRILEAQSACVEPGPRRIGMFFAPVVDGASLPRPPLDAIAGGSAREVELIVSTMADEMQLYHLVPGFGELDEEQLLSHVRRRLSGSTPDAADRARAILSRYAGVGDDPRRRFFAIETDASLWIPATRLAESQARHQPRTWMARFDWRSPLRGGSLGACHALDIPFTLGNHRLPEVRPFAGEGEDADAVAANVMDAWAAFARDGDPSHPGIGAWPPYAPPRRETLLIDAVCRVVDAPNEARRRAWIGPTPDGVKAEAPVV